MAIQITIQDAKVIGGNLALAITTTNSDKPGQSERMEMSYPTAMSALEIKAAIDAAATLLWTAINVKSWEV